VDLPLDVIVQVIEAFGVSELNVEAFFDAHLHFDRLVVRRFGFANMYNDFLVFGQWREEFAFDDNAEEVTYRDIAAVVGLVGFGVGAEMEGDGCLRLVECSGWVDFFGEGNEIVMWPALINGVGHINPSKKLNFDSIMIISFTWL